MAQPELHPAADDDIELGCPPLISSAGNAGPPLPVFRLHAWPAGSGQSIDCAAAACRRQVAAQRWRRACRAVMEGRQASRCVDLLGNRLAPTDDRLHAVIALHMRMAACPHAFRRRLTHALFAQRQPGSVSCSDHLLNEFYITGEQMFGFFAPPGVGQHRPYIIPCLTGVLVLLFFFMAGQYGQYQAVASPTTTACVAAMRHNGTAPGWGPGQLVHWIAPSRRGWCYGSNDPYRLDATFLIDWGARWAPDLRRQPQRLLTSALLHQSFSHLLSNALLLLALGLPMECKHGSWRVAAAVVLAALGGNLLSAVTEAPCTAVVGASGVVFGMAGLTLADAVLNWETLRRPLLRSLLLLAFLVYFAVTVGTTPTGTSHMSHVGGFLCGLLPGLVLLTNVHRTPGETAATAVAAAGCCATFAALTLVLYLRQLPDVSCT